MDLTSLTEATWAQLHALVDWTAPWVAHLGPLEPWLWGTSGAGALALLLAVRRGRRGGLLRRLRRPLQHLPGPVAQRLPWRETAGVVAGATALDLLTAMVRIDPQALDAIDRAHGARTFDSFIDLQRHILEVADRGPQAYAGLVSQYKGALGEGWAAEHLRRAGFDVSYAPDPNQAGWDLLVDGAPTQVKSGLDPQGIHEALNLYPHIPVLTVSDHAGGFPESAVGTLPWSGAEVNDATRESLDAIEGVGDLSFEIPVITLGISAWRHQQAYQAGRMSGEAAVGNTLAETAAVGIGAKIGASIGSFLLPGVGTFIGGFLGALFGRGALDDLRRRPLIDHAHLERCIEALCLQFAAFADDAIQVAQARKVAIGGAIRRISGRRRLIKRLLVARSDVVAREAITRLRCERDELRVMLARLEAAQAQNDLVQVARIWSGPLPTLAGLRALDERIVAIQRQVQAALARSVPTPDLSTMLMSPGGRPWAAAGMRRIEPAPPGRLLNRWAGVSLLLGGSAGLLAAHAAGLPGTRPLPAAGHEHTQPPGRAAYGHPKKSSGPGRSGPRNPQRADDLAGRFPSGSDVSLRQACRLRTDASLEAAVVATLAAKSVCTVFALDDAWAQVECEPSAIGFLHRDCLRSRAVGDAPPPTPPVPSR